MSSVVFSNVDDAMIYSLPLGQPLPEETGRLHRLRSVRQSEGISRRAMARRLNTDVQSVTRQEDESADLPLSTLYRWQAALGIPIEELLVETGAELSPPVLERSQMLRLMKTAMSIVEQAKQLGIRRMGQNMVDQLLEIMPELAGVGAWPSVGQRRSLKELGQAAQRFFAGGPGAGPDE
jgi:transcriptional regulator with XRE-family HTH domain